VSEEDLRRDTLLELKRELGTRLLSSEQVSPLPGLPTGWGHLDRHLLWHGIPKGALTLLVSEAGGATDLWIRTAAQVTQAGQWVAWVNDADLLLTPWILRHRKVDLSKLLCVAQPRDEKQLLWALQELMSLSLFELVGCDLGELHLRESQVLKLKKMAMRYQTGLVLLTRAKSVHLSSFYSLILSFQKNHVIVNRSLHRPTPFTLERRDLYADTLPLLAAGRRALCG